jgi:hypothetical protein
MATQWYYQFMNDVVGPLTSSQLADRVRTGQVKEDTLIRKDDSQWVPASQVSGLLDSIKSQAGQRICPYCGTPVDRPPTTCHGCNRKLVLSLNSKLTSAGEHNGSAKRPQRDREAEERVAWESSERSELARYALLLLVWLGLLVVAPYLIYLASSGHLFFRGDLTFISIGAVIAAVGGLYYWISRLA